jgi:conjugal transfer pilus assembly protein TraW
VTFGIEMRPKSSHFKIHRRSRAPRIGLMSIHSHIFASLLISLLPIAHADDLGVVGPTYGIAEPDLLEVIQSRLYQMEKTGDLAKKQDEYRDHVIGAVEKPKPVLGIKATAVKRTFYYDPTMILDHDIRGESAGSCFP